MSKTEVLMELFNAYGDDAEGALAAMANLDPQVWAEFTENAAERQYQSEYRSWVRRQTHEFSAASAPRLFDTADMKTFKMRDRIVLVDNGIRIEHHLSELAGEDGAAVLLAAAERDERGAKTTISRTSALKKLAKEMVKRSKVEGRPVSVAEILAGAA